MWSAIRLDSDPAHRHNWSVTPCKDDKENCVSWDLRDTWVDPGLLEKVLLLSAFPAFILGKFFVALLGWLGINQVWTFMSLMPLLIFAWYYFIGWLLDRLIRRQNATNHANS